MGQLRSQPPQPRTFELDPFQRQAVAALDAGESVLVAAPTGAGKTVVAEHAVDLALQQGAKAFYTTPIKALSNQKFNDLVERHGRDRVGLLTGDNSINGTADVVVMTTEVLRNMIYTGSPQLQGLRYVILDEVHFLQDTYRGPVWEEVIIHLQPSVRLVCLSATVSNASDVAEWLTTVRGPTRLIFEDERPVELRNLYLVGDRTSERAHLLPILVGGRPNPEAEKMDGDGSHREGRPYHRGRRRRRRFFTPRRPEIIEMLEDREMLPVLYFIFSRAACEDAVRACADAGLRLTAPEERKRIRAIAAERTSGLSDGDLDVLGYNQWLSALELGVAAHHAGMVPPFKEAVEACFVEGLVKAVFATETLALGINMPARSVVIERLTKFTGETRAFLTPAEYTQLTGRAGRRGIDTVGYAIVPWSPFVAFGQVAGLAASKTYTLRSAFRPTYNMAANLVRRYEPDEAHHLLNLSLAQYQADAAVVTLQARAQRSRERLERLRVEATCERGDVAEYHRLRSLAGQERRAQQADLRHEVEEAVSRLSPGDVIELSGDRLAVLSVAYRKGGSIKVRAVGANGDDMTLGLGEFAEPPQRLGSVELPVPYTPNNRAFQHQVGDSLRRARLGKRYARGGKDRRATQGFDPDDTVAAGTRDNGGNGASAPNPLDEADEHPVATCPDRDRHLRALMQAQRAEKELTGTERQVRSQRGSLVRRFDQVLKLLEAWDYLDGWALTQRGEVLARTYHECDLFVAEAMAAGLLDGLDPASLAGMVSGFTYEHRGPSQPPAPWFPSRRARERWARLEELHGELIKDEEALGLPITRQPDPGFFVLAHAWAGGEPLAEVLAEEELSAGDFVRNIRTLVDLLRQVGEVAPHEDTARAARQAAEALQRGVVVASSVLEDVVTPAGGEEP